MCAVVYNAIISSAITLWFDAVVCFVLQSRHRLERLSKLTDYNGRCKKLRETLEQYVLRVFVVCVFTVIVIVRW